MTSRAARAPAGTPAGGVPAGVRLQPFRGLHYSPAAAADLSDVTLAPPPLWDFTALADLARNHDHHVLRLLAPSLTAGSSAVVTGAEWAAEGTLVADPSPALYVWRWSQAGHSVVGVAGALPLPAPGVCPHEQVRPGLLAERAAELGTGAVQPEPIVLLYDGEQPLTADVDTLPSIVTLEVDDGVHDVSALCDTAGIDRVNHTLAGRSLVLADGHHRFSVLSSLPAPQPRAFVLVVDVRRSDLNVGAIPRVAPEVDWSTVTGTPGAVLVELGDEDRQTFLEGVPAGQLRWVVADQSRTVGLELSTSAADALAPQGVQPCGPVASDVCHLHRHLLPRWGVAGDRVRYAHSWETARAQAAAAAGLAVDSRAPRLREVMAAARSGTLLPHKATSIAPKPRTGLLMLGDAIVAV